MIFVCAIHSCISLLDGTIPSALRLIYSYTTTVRRIRFSTTRSTKNNTTIQVGESFKPCLTSCEKIKGQGQRSMTPADCSSDVAFLGANTVYSTLTSVTESIRRPILSKTLREAAASGVRRAATPRANRGSAVDCGRIVRYESCRATNGWGCTQARLGDGIKRHTKTVGQTQRKDLMMVMCLSVCVDAKK